MFLTYICLIQLNSPPALYSTKHFSLLKSTINLIFPQNCVHCENEIGVKQNFLCSPCWERIEISYNVKSRVLSSLNYRLDIHEIFSLYDYTKINPIQSLIHSMKYNYQFSIAGYLGQQLGMKIQESKNTIDIIDSIVPIPIHHSKEFNRGFNQSTDLARGISKRTGIPIEKHLLSKNIEEKSQTKKSILSRKQNLNNKFNISNKANESKHILIVDDIFTTGATLEAAFSTIKKSYPNMQISFACIALTKS